MDHSKRVSAKENVDAFKGWIGRLRAGLAAWAESRPLRRFLRRFSVSTTLGVAGIVLSVAALLLVIGIGETQIVASENAGNHTANLFANGWFDVGIAFALAGILIGTVAVAANGSHTRALKGFPDVEIRILWHAAKDVLEPGHPVGFSRRGRLVHMRLLVRNNEQARPVALSVGLSYLVLPGTFPASIAEFARTDRMAFVATTWMPAAGDIDLALGIRMLESPIHVDIQSQREGDVFFFVPKSEVANLEPDQIPTVLATDLRTYRSVEFAHGYPLDEVLQ